VIKTQAAAVGDHETLHIQGFMRLFEIEFLDKGIELGLLFQDILAPAGSVASCFSVRCVHSWRPFCWG